MLQLNGVSKSFSGVVALRETTLTIREGRTTVLIGPSGCGKSTLLRVMVGLIAPDAGEVILAGRPLTPQDAAERRREIGFVVQEGGLFPHLTARDNVTLQAKYLGWDATRCDGRLADLVKLTRFPEEKLSLFPAQLSGGQRQRVGLMRGLMLDPALILLDEPLGALDALVRSELQEDLKDIFGRLKKTVVLVTHDLGEAAYLGDELILMQSGAVVQQGTFADLVEQPAAEFVTKFVNAQRPVPVWGNNPGAGGKGEFVAGRSDGRFAPTDR